MDPNIIRPDVSLFRSFLADAQSVTLQLAENEEDNDNDEAPETPTDEPLPIPIQDPPADQSPGVPLTVTCLSSCPT
jgi:hypothetical protein